MIRENILKITLVLIISTAALSITTLAQEWSAEQKEVWEVCTNWFELFKNNDLEGVKATYHKDYVGWSWGNYATEGYAETLKWANHMVPKVKIAYINLKPLDILVMNDVAVLHYYYTMVQTVDGKEKREQGRWTDVLKKKGVNGCSSLTLVVNCPQNRKADELILADKSGRVCERSEYK